jgi:DNA-binding LytR/AlgR family response regulator
MPKLTAVIVEDEPASRDRLRRLLAAHPELVEIVGEAGSGPGAVEVIGERKPELVFLDISLPGFDGFEVLHQLTMPVKVVFTTAFVEHAVQAFRERAVHYLVKPVDPEQLEDALHRIVALGPPRDTQELQRGGLSRILCRDRDTTHVIRPGEILFLKADQGYTLVRTSSNEFLTSDPLTYLEHGLGAEFVRIHRNALVNVTHVESLKHLDGEVTIVLRNGMELPVSRRHAPTLRDKLLYGADRLPPG